ncbi:MAG: FAD-dependent monooxygenase, partial [Aggregatilineales bacterium]
FVGLGTHRHRMVIYPISAPDADGMALVNWIAEVTMDDVDSWHHDGWFRPVELSEFIYHFEDFRYDWLDVPSMLENADCAFENPMIDRDPVPRWTFGRVTLMGDAAHPMRPNGSNGSSQAIIDAETLAEQFQQHDTMSQALQAYEAIRLEPMRTLVLENRKAGPERVMQMAEDNCDGKCTEVCTHVPSDILEQVANRYKQIAGFDKDAVRKATGMD